MKIKYDNEFENRNWVVSSVVERLPYKQMVTGSNPVPLNI